MSKTRIRTLLVEDSDIVARFLTEILEFDEGDNIEIVRAERLADAAAVLKQREFDVLLLDMSLPDSHGMDRIIRTGTIRTESAERC